MDWCRWPVNNVTYLGLKLLLLYESCFRHRANCSSTSCVPGAPVMFRFAIAVFRSNTSSASRPKVLSTDCNSASVSWFSGLLVFSASATTAPTTWRSEEHTSELQSHVNLV